MFWLLLLRVLRFNFPKFRRCKSGQLDLWGTHLTLQLCSVNVTALCGTRLNDQQVLSCNQRQSLNAQLHQKGILVFHALCLTTFLSLSSTEVFGLFTPS